MDKNILANIFNLKYRGLAESLEYIQMTRFRFDSKTDKQAKVCQQYYKYRFFDTYTILNLYMIKDISIIIFRLFLQILQIF